VDVRFRKERFVPEAGSAQLETLTPQQIRPISGARVRVLCAIPFILLLAGPTTGQAREFSGTIQEVDAGGLLLQNRRGDEIRFQRVPETRVSGRGGQNASWSGLRAGERATVRWKLADSPPVAYEVIVLPRRDGER